MAKNRPQKQNSNRKKAKKSETEIQFVENPVLLQKDVTVEIVNPEMVIEAEAPHTYSSPTEVRPFDANADVYLEIHRGNIFHYFSSALVAPSRYFERRAFEDVQSRHKEFLIFANGSSGALDDNTVLLQVELNTEEKNALEVLGSIAYLSAVLPITRILKIITVSDKVSKAIVSDALLFNGGFIPEKLFTTAPVAYQYDLKVVNAPTPLFEDLKQSIKRFDHILGLFAFLQNYCLLVADKISTYKSLPDHFFYAMQALKPSFGNKILPKHNIHEFYSFLFNENTPPDKQLLKWIFNRIRIEDNFHDDDIKEFQNLFNSIQDEAALTEQANGIFSALRQNLERKSVLPEIDSSKSKSALPLYAFAFLRNYANLNNIEVARKDIANVFSPLYGEYAFALLGYFYGYSNLKNTDDRLSISNPAIAYLKLTDKKPPIKYKLESAFDHTIINQVYYKIFGGRAPEVENMEGTLISDGYEILPGSTFEIALQSFKLIDSDYQRVSLKRVATPEPQSVKTLKSDLMAEFSKLPDRISYNSDLGVLCRRLNLTPITSGNVSSNFLQMSPLEIIQSCFYFKTDLENELQNKATLITDHELKLRIELSKIVDKSE